MRLSPTKTNTKASGEIAPSPHLSVNGPIALSAFLADSSGGSLRRVPFSGPFAPPYLFEIVVSKRQQPSVTVNFATD